jgi:hypothetical protein
MYSKKINLIIGIVFDNKAKNLGDALNFSSSNMSRWRNDKPMMSIELQKLFDFGINMNWFFDNSNTDISDMFNNTENGQALRRKYFPEKKTYDIKTLIDTKRNSYEMV